MADWKRFTDEAPPKGEMFIWGLPRGDRGWAVGLAYWNVSGGYSDAYGSTSIRGATHWHPMPEPPADG